MRHNIFYAAGYNRAITDVIYFFEKSVTRKDKRKRDATDIKKIVGNSMEGAVIMLKILRSMEYKLMRYGGDFEVGDIKFTKENIGKERWEKLQAKHKENEKELNEKRFQIFLEDVLPEISGIASLVEMTGEPAKKILADAWEDAITIRERESRINKMTGGKDGN